MTRQALSVLLACGAVSALLAVPAASPAGAPTATQAYLGGHIRGDRVGGIVRRAWPRTGRAPRQRQARWLARQVGAKQQRSCARQRSKARARCKLSARGSATAASLGAAATLSIAAGDPGSPRGPVVRTAALVASDLSAVQLPLQLVRSYEIPADDPSYKRLLNWSWTYDSAVAAAAFAASGNKANAAQLLDQLAALQYADGSLEIAFNTVTGEGARIFRTGTVAWAGLAAATYDQAFGSTRYLESQRRTAEYLLSLQRNTGLIPGGPDVTWVSTQHNLITYVFLTRLANELRDTGDTKGATQYQTAATTIGATIDENLLVVDKDGARFRQGQNDDTPAVDVQALGAMYLQGRGKPELAAQVLAYAQSTFAVGDRSVRESSELDTFNLTYTAGGPFTGYTPYAAGAGPDVIWAEASGEMRLAQATLGQDTGALDKSIERWASITGGAGPLQADRTVTTDPSGADYHVWPAATAAAWTVLARTAPAFFAAPLAPSTTLVTDWTKVRGGNLVTTYPDGRVAMTTGGVERRVLDVSAPAADYTVTSNATLQAGAGYGIYVRASVDPGTKITAFCVQLDHGYGAGQIVIREVLADSELAVPIAHVAVPAGFNWYGVAHIVAVTVKGNTMRVSLDGAQVVSVADLAAASAFAVKYAYGSASTLGPPLAGGYGMRAFGNGLVSLQQMTVGPAS